MNIAAELSQLFYYLNAFWTVVVINCLHPVNWEYCLPVQDWLFPAIHEAWVIKTDPDFLYKHERDILNSIK